MIAEIAYNRGYLMQDLSHGPALVINKQAQTVCVCSTQVSLTNKEYQVLLFLVDRKGAVTTKQMFLDHLYLGVDVPEIKIIDVFICKVRKKLAEPSSGENFISTVWGRGYSVDPSVYKLEEAA